MRPKKGVYLFICMKFIWIFNLRHIA